MLDLIGAYENYLTKVKQASANTIASYMRDIRQYAAWLRNSENVDVKVYGVNGQLIMSDYVGSVTSGMDSQFNLGSIENGAYIVKVSGENINETFRLLIVK